MDSKHLRRKRDGVVAAQRLCLEATRRRGRIAFIGECEDDLRVRVGPDFIRNGYALYGSWYYSRRDVDAVLKVIEDSPLVEHSISHALPVSRVQEAFELFASHRMAKVVSKPCEWPLRTAACSRDNCMWVD